MPAKTAPWKKRKLVRLLIIIVGCGLGVGILLGVVHYAQDELRIVKGNHDNGMDKEVWVYRRGVFGKQEKVREIAYFEDGSKEYEVEYRKGKVNGWARMWYESGQLRLECPYKNSRPHGVRRAYHENGRMFCRAEYEHGRLLCRKNWDEDGNEIYLDMDRPDPF